MKTFLPIFLLASALTQAQQASLPADHAQRRMAGWTVQLDQRLLNGEHAPLGRQALTLLDARLNDIVTVVPAKRVAELRKVVIWLDLDHGELTRMQYHPSAGWLEKNGYSASLAKAVHIPSAARFVDKRHQHTQPWCVLHELAHAYHDQVLDFDHAGIREVWERYDASGRGRRVLHVSGRMQRHYALTNAKEFFAEMTEAYFGVNDFHPFVHGELKQSEPETHALLQEIWGKTALEE